MAGVPGLEPGPKVLETSMLTIDTIPLQRSQISDLKFEIINLFVFSVQPVAAAAATELVEFQAVRRGLLVLGRHVVALFALGALQNDVISCSLSHFLPLLVRVTPTGVQNRNG